MALLTRDQIIQAQDIKVEDVDVPEWGGSVRIRGLNARERSRLEATLVAVKGETLTIKIDALQTLREQLVGTVLIDEQGNRLFGDSELKELSKKSGGVLQRLFDKAQQLSGMTEEAVKRADTNLGNGQKEDSSSD